MMLRCGLSPSVLVVDDDRHVAFEGDLFESESDIENPSYWIAVSLLPGTQAASRHDVVTRFTIDFVVPGHGGMFQLTADHVKLLASQTNTSYVY